MILLQEIKTKKNLVKNHIELLLVTSLLVSRILIAGIMAFVFPKYTTLFNSIHGIGTYLLTAIFIWLKKDKLRDYHIKVGAIGVFILMPIIASILYFSQLYKNANIRLLFPFVGIVLAIALILSRKLLIQPFSKESLKQSILWVIEGAIIGVFVGVILSFFIFFQQNTTLNKTSATFSAFINLFVVQTGNAAVTEEPVYRGILWGYLKNKGWYERYIWFIQGALFWLAHIYYIKSSPYSFWILVPTAGLVLGWLAWKSRSIAVSMVAHGFMNAVGQLLSFYKI